MNSLIYFIMELTEADFRHSSVYYKYAIEINRKLKIMGLNYKDRHLLSEPVSPCYIQEISARKFKTHPLSHS